MSCSLLTMREALCSVSRLCFMGLYVVAVLASLAVGNQAYATASASPDHSPVPSLYSLYKENRTAGISNYITIDLPLVTYSLLRQQGIQFLETHQILPLVEQMLSELDSSIAEEYAAAEARDEDDIYRQALVANQQYVLLLQSLLLGHALPQLTPDSLDELDKIVLATGVEHSTVWGRKVDYTQYKPRGHYTDTNQSMGLFRVLRYAGSQTFCIVSSAATGVSSDEQALQIRQMQQLTSLLRNNEHLAQLRRSLNSSLEWQFGSPDDLTDGDIHRALGDIDDLPVEQAGDRLLRYAQDNQRQPRIVDMLVDATLLEDGRSIADAVTGWRLFPSRYSVQSASQQALLFNQTSAYYGDSMTIPFGLGMVNGRAVKAFPAALEWIALLGEKNALGQLNSASETAFEGYTDAFGTAGDLLQELQGAELMNAQVIRSAFNGSEALPSYDNQSLLAFQAWQRYASVLHAKQSYTPSAKSFTAQLAPRETADLDIATDLYLTLGLSARLHHEKTQIAAWMDFAAHMDKLAVLSVQRDNGAQLSAVDVAYLNALDEEFSALVGTSDMPVVVDVHTDPNSQQVVQHATGYARAIHLQNARHQTMRGARLSFVEFKQPIDNRLTVESWQKRLEEDALLR